MINRLVVGRGNKRQAFDIPSRGIEREKAVEDMKNFIARPKLFLAALGIET